MANGPLGKLLHLRAAPFCLSITTSMLTRVASSLPSIAFIYQFALDGYHVFFELFLRGTCNVVGSFFTSVVPAHLAAR